MRAGLLFGLILNSFALYAVTDFDRDQVQQRISPVGQVTVQGAPSADAAKSTPPTQKSEAKAPGQEIYEQYCHVCHEAGVAGAPKFRDANDWKPRLAKGIPTLVSVATKGLNAMPAKGTCVDCSEADLKAAIEYMATIK